MNGDGELIIIFPTSPLPNLYLLSGLAKIAEVIRLSSSSEKHIHLLLLQDFSRFPDYLKTQLVDHHEGLIKNVDDKLETIGEIQKLNFLSLFKYVVMDLADLDISERRKIALNVVDYNIGEYPVIEEKIDHGGHLSHNVDGNWDTFVDSKIVEDIFSTVEGSYINDIYFRGEKPLMKDLLILASYTGNTELHIVVADKVKQLIDGYRQQYSIYSSAKVVDFSADFLKMKHPVVFQTLISKYINKQKAPGWTDEIHGEDIVKSLKCKLFPTEGEIGENINEGFLSIQEELIKQLALIG